MVELPIASHADCERVVEILAAHSATVLVATPSTLMHVATHLRQHGHALNSPRLALYAGEPLYRDQRSLFGEAFPQAQPYPFSYVSSDIGVVAMPVMSQDDQRLYRAHTAQVIVEIIDSDTGEPVTRPGRPGRVVVTSLLRRLMPVIRYPVGDMAEWSDTGPGHLRLLGRSSGHARIGTARLDLDVLLSHIYDIIEEPEPPSVQIVFRHHQGKDQLVARIAANVPDPERSSRLLQDRFRSTQPEYRYPLERGGVHPLAVEWVSVGQLAVNPRTGRILPTVDERDPTHS